MNALWHDPVVAEIHAVREYLEGQYHGNLAAYSAAAEAHCRKLGLNVAGYQYEDSADGINSAQASREIRHFANRG